MSRLNREQIEELREAIKVPWPGCASTPERDTEMDALCDLALAGLREDGWVMVKDRLPDEDAGAVLCYWGDHVPVDIGCCWECSDGVIWQDANDNMGEFGAPPTHWMPLPAKPDGG